MPVAAAEIDVDTEVAALLRRAGQRYTTGRRRVVVALQSGDGPLTITQILDTDRRLAQFEGEIRASVDPWLKGEDGGDAIRATLTHLTAMFEVMHAHRTSVAAVAQAAGGHPVVYQEWQRRVVDYFVDLTADFIRRQYDDE